MDIILRASPSSGRITWSSSHGLEIDDNLVPDPVVAKELNVTTMTLWRWTNDAELGFPKPIKIRERNYRSRRALEEFKARMMQRAPEAAQ